VRAPYAVGYASTLYDVDDIETGRRGVLKLLPRVARSLVAERQRMRRELLKQATLTSPHLTSPIAVGEHDGCLWVFRPFVEGVSLRALLHTRGALEPAQALSIAAQVTQGLDTLHRSGLLHRDLKPEHVILSHDAEGRSCAVLIDAGVSRHVKPTAGGLLCGTPGYVAPEHLLGKLVSFRSDLYALGCVLYEMLSGSGPFVRDDEQATLAAQLAGETPTLSDDHRPALIALLRSLLSKDPHDRPFSAQKVRRALDPFLTDGIAVTLPPSPPSTFARPARDLQVPKPPAPSRIPPPPPATSAGDKGSTPSAPPPPARPNRGDATEPLQLDQLLELRTSHATAVAPPTPPRADRRSADATQPIGIESILSVERFARAVPKAPPEKPEYKPTADHTQPIRLDQILSVAAERKKALSVPKVPSPSSERPPAPVERVDASHYDLDVEIPDDAAVEPVPRSDTAGLPTPADHAPPHAVAADEPLAEAHDSTETHDSTEGGDEPAEPAPVTREEKRAVQSTLVGMPAPSAVLEPAASATGARPSQAPAAQSQARGPTSQELTLPRDPALAVAEAERMQSHDDEPVVLPERSVRTIAYAAAALVLLGLVGLGVAQLFGDEPESVAKPEATSHEPAPKVAAAAPTAPAASAPIVQPLAEAPKPSIEPIAVAKVEEVEEAKAPTEAQPEAEEGTDAEDEAEAVAARSDEKVSKATERRRARAEKRRSRERSSSSRASRAKNDSGGSDLEKWQKARDEARKHFAAKRYRDAARAYEQASRLNPTDAGTFAGLGGSRLSAGDATGAVKAYQRAIKLSPRTAGFHAALGRAYLSAGDKAKARAAYKRALELDPNNSAAKRALASL
jgi:serine/threonine-protein kinase